MEDRKFVNLNIPREYRDLLNAIAEFDRRSMSSEVQILIDRRAQELGLKPIAPTHVEYAGSVGR